MEYFATVLGIIIAGAAGFIFGRNYSTDAKEKSRLEQDLKNKQAELEAFRGKVTSHFEKTADLFNQVSDSYQSLYDHIAKSSNQLCSAPSFQSLPKKETEHLGAPEKQAPKAGGEELFDANKLYNAHDYRNHLEETATETEKESDTVVKFSKAKEKDSSNSSEPALDYAVKAEGVINHNSLDIDGVKTS
ncbi:YhcB family protein [Aliikangiella sp. G2MR2-5]|uniref:YhcB family protein n=1 Tax=Aliikangiella sp. G2MR2-5 TaxID=2788943 RepID=UPI0018A99C10|nr:DUF1043 family protein [Aliikangiella sp. G2MR2-5]